VDDRPPDRRINDKANAAFAKNRFEEACELYRQCIGINPNEPVYYSNRAVCEYRMNRFQASLNDADACIKLCQNLKGSENADQWDKPHYRKCKALLAIGRAPEAQAYLKKILKWFPNSAAIASLVEETNTAVKAAVKGQGKDAHNGLGHDETTSPTEEAADEEENDEDGNEEENNSDDGDVGKDDGEAGDDEEENADDDEAAAGNEESEKSE